ncbi:MAG: glutamate-1-semialdehyde 2,1-aminomutase [Planctomycetota bacterium]
MTEKAEEAPIEAARRYIPGGVNSPVRAFEPVGGDPPFIRRGEGSHIVDTEGREYIDYVGSWGPLILGHAHPEVVRAVREAAADGTSFGAPTEAETELARLIVERVPSVQMVRLVNSGTEATMTAARLARAFTGRDKIVKFSGCYHGHADPFLVMAGSGATTLGTPTSPGVPEHVANDTLVAEFNDAASVESLLDAFPGEVAAVIVEPVCGNSGVIPPVEGFLQGLRELTEAHSALLIFDEVMTGFRVAPESAQGLYGVEPDLTTLGKVIGGGMPIGAVGGRRKIMEQLAPTGPVYQAGTLSGNPLATAAGLSTLKALDAETYDRMGSIGAQLERGIRDNIERVDVPLQFRRVGSMACLFFSDRPVLNHADAQACDADRFAAYHRRMLRRGIYLPPSQFESFFISAAHTVEDVHRTVEANLEALREVE